jgi:carbon monoxide dehydrogenase subunit G
MTPMEMTGEFRIPAPRQRVWEALNDPEILKQSIPGCQTLEKVSETEFNGKVVAAVGPVKATFGGKVTLSDLDPPQSYTISGEGSGGVAGFAKGGAKVNLAEDGPATVLTYSVQAQVGGRLAQVGSRLIDGVARKMANDFFGRFAAAVAPEESPATAGESTTSEAAVATPAAESERASVQTPPPVAVTSPTGIRLPPAVWVTGLAVIVVVILYFFTTH